MNEIKVTSLPTKKLIDIDGSIIKKKVCVYARVSTQKGLQKSSFELQISTYHKQIQDNPLWEFAGIFSDCGKSGTSTAKRTEFNKMIELARMGQINIILTKSVSRFTRDIVNGLSIIQELRNIGVEVYFEKENISSLDPSFDFFLTIYSSVAEKESKSNSENVLWSYKRKMEQGGNTTPLIYGYTFDKNRNFVINEKEAKAVRLMFDLFIRGYKIIDIINELKIKGYKAKKGYAEFSASVIRQILRNEKYMGDMLLQKTTVKKIGDRSSMPNKTKRQYYVENSHEGIVSKEVFNTVQEMIKDRQCKFKPKRTIKLENNYSDYIFSVIGQRYYRSKVNHRNTKWEVRLLELVDANKNRILEGKNIYHKQIDLLLENALETIIKDFKLLYIKIDTELRRKVSESKINERLDTLQNQVTAYKSEIDKIKAFNIDASAKKLLTNKLLIELEETNELLIKTQYEKLTVYNYDKNLSLFKKVIHSALKKRDIDVKEAFSKIIAIDRENFLLCIHLSNRNILDIDLINEIKNVAIYGGNFKFKQTRLQVKVTWHIIII